MILRADNTSRLVEEYGRMFLRRYSSQRLPPKQVKLSSSGRVFGLEDAPAAVPALKHIIAGTDKA